MIVDVRHNNGGNNGLLKPFLRTLAWFNADRPGNRIYVLAGRNTFSAAQNFVARVERRADAVFVGEPSACPPERRGRETNVVLPYSAAQHLVPLLAGLGPGRPAPLDRAGHAGGADLGGLLRRP